MKHLSLRPILAAFAALFVTAGFAQAHPGHFAFDWTALPHAGHEKDYVALFTILALTTIGCLGHWFAARQR